MHGFASSLYFFYVALILLISSMSFWFTDVFGEATYLGNHTLAVQRGLNMGIALFIVSKELFLSSPPRPHAFAGPPLQSSLDISNILKKITLSKVISITITVIGMAILRYIYFGGLVSNPLDIAECITWA
jgi:hypothetical protein